jgi:hypothetical protein
MNPGYWALFRIWITSTLAADTPGRQLDGPPFPQFLSHFRFRSVKRYPTPRTCTWTAVAGKYGSQRQQYCNSARTETLHCDDLPLFQMATRSPFLEPKTTRKRREEQQWRDYGDLLAFGKYRQPDTTHMRSTSQRRQSSQEPMLGQF